MYAPTIIRIVAGAAYDGSILPLQIIMPLMLIIGYEQILVLQVLTPMNKDNSVLINSIAGATMGIILNIILVPTYGRIGSAIVWICSEMIVLILAQFFVKRYILLSFPYKKYTKYIIFSIPGFIICIIIKFCFDYSISSFITSGIMVGTYFYILYAYILKSPYIVSLNNTILSKVKK